MTNDIPAWRCGDRVRDDDYGKEGTVEEVGTTIDDRDLAVIYVRWGDGTRADFVPNERTHRIGGATC